MLREGWIHLRDFAAVGEKVIVREVMVQNEVAMERALLSGAQECESSRVLEPHGTKLLMCRQVGDVSESHHGDGSRWTLEAGRSSASVSVPDLDPEECAATIDIVKVETHVVRPGMKVLGKVPHDLVRCGDVDID